MNRKQWIKNNMIKAHQGGDKRERLTKVNCGQHQGIALDANKTNTKPLNCVQCYLS